MIIKPNYFVGYEEIISFEHVPVTLRVIAYSEIR